MAFSKVIVQGENGSLSVAEAAGFVTLQAAAKGSLGGGKAAGSVQFESLNRISLSGAQLLELAFDFLESKSPAGVVIIEEAVKAKALALLAQA